MNSTYLTIKNTKGQLVPLTVLKRNTIANAFELKNKYNSSVYLVSLFEVEKVVPEL